MTNIAVLPHPSADLLEPFLESQLASSTRQAYRADLIAFFGTSLVTVDQVTGVAVEDVEQFRNDLIANDAKNTTVNRKLTSLRGFFRRMVAKGICKKNPADPALVRNMKVSDSSVGKAIATKHINAMLRLAQSNKNELMAKRDHALMLVLLYAGLRRAEATRLRWSHIREEGSHLIAVLPNTKSGMEQHVKLSPVIVKALQALSDAYQDQFDYVFVSLSTLNYGQSMRPATVTDIVKGYGKQVGIDISAHSFRHTCCTLAFEGGAQPQKVQGHLRHADLKTTLRYYQDRDSLDDNATDYITTGDNNE
jgi:site-specific recombinase XerD